MWYSTVNEVIPMVLMYTHSLQCYMSGSSLRKALQHCPLLVSWYRFFQHFVAICCYVWHPWSPLFAYLLCHVNINTSNVHSIWFTSDAHQKQITRFMWTWLYICVGGNMRMQGGSWVSWTLLLNQLSYKYGIPKAVVAGAQVSFLVYKYSVV